MELRPMSQKDVKTFLEWFASDTDLGKTFYEIGNPVLPSCYLGIYTTELIGIVCYQNIDFRSKKAELGFYAKKPLAVKVWRNVLEKAFNELGLNRIYVRPLVNNPIVGIEKRLGFIQEGIEREAVFHDGKFEDIVVLSIIKSEYKGCDTNGT